MPRTRGTELAAPHRRKRRLGLDQLEAAEDDVTAMNRSTIVLMNETVEKGMRPNSGRTERSQPNTRPAMSAPPAVDKVSGTP